MVGYKLKRYGNSSFVSSTMCHGLMVACRVKGRGDHNTWILAIFRYVCNYLGLFTLETALYPMFAFITLSPFLSTHPNPWS